jgi:hypothetical protein
VFINRRIRSADFVFGAHITHGSLSFITLNMSSTAKRRTNYSTMGDLFQDIAGQLNEFTLSGLISTTIFELLKFVADFIDINFADFVQNFLRKEY